MGGPGRHVIYSGAHTEEAGLPLLLAAISLIQLRDVTFTITGDRGHHAGLARLVAADPRVRTTGHLSEAALDELCLSASAFVNPRPPGHAASIASFPSKLMRYLAFGKPVASTWTPGLAEAYRPLLVVADDASPQSLATAITQAVTMSEAERQGLRERIRAFLIPGRLWTTQASRFAAFADAVAASPRRVA